MRWIKRLSPALLWGLPLVFILPRGELALLASAVLWHEGGHLIALAMLGEPTPSLAAVAAGLTLRVRRPLSYWKEAFVALAGPLANLLLAVPLLLSRGVGGGGQLAGAVHLLTAIANLLPLPASDGGRALRALLSLLLPLRICDMLCHGVALATLATGVLLALFLLLAEGGGGALILLVGLLSRATATRH